MSMEIFCDFSLQCGHELPNTPENHKCHRRHRRHGHNYQIRLYVGGEIDPDLGWVIDYADVQNLWCDVVRSKLDHTWLNDTIPNATCENLALWIWQQLQPKLPANVRITKIRLQEYPTTGVVFTPPE